MILLDIVIGLIIIFGGNRMFDRKQAKFDAKEQIKGNIGMMVAIIIIAGLIAMTVIGSLFMPAMYLGLCLIFIGMTNGVKPTVMDLFKRANSFGRALWLNIIIGFFTMLWMFLLIVPGIIKALSYSMGAFVLAENPDWSARECLNESKRIMKGNVGKLFVLQLSFIPWFLLCGATFGIAAIYVVPYFGTTIASFYKSISDI